MEKLREWAPAVLTLVIALFVSYFNTGANAIRLSSIAGSLPATEQSVPAENVPGFSVSEFEIATGTEKKLEPSTPSTSLAPAKPTPTAPPAAEEPAAPEVSTPITTPAAADASTTPLLQTIAGSLVNIICVSTDPLFPSTSGTGVIIDSRGIILTVAHVAQYFILQDYLSTGTVSCVIRTGSPARTAYKASPIYVSRPWILANADILTKESPKGTGENDFALLAITESATNKSLPSSFPALPLTSRTASVGDEVAIGSYGAQYLTSAQIRSALYPTLLLGEIKDRYTYNKNSVDLLSLLGGAAAQEGSSGGVFVNMDGEIIGTITTSKVSGDVATRELRAITPLHMRTSYKEDTGNDFDTHFDGMSTERLVTAFFVETQKLGLIIVKAVR